MQITALYAGVLGLWFLALSMRVVRKRQAGISMGDGGDSEMLRRIRGHANFSEYVPLCLILIAANEMLGAAVWLVHALGAALLLARILHGISLSYTEKWFFGRFHGTLLTYIVLLVSSLGAIWLSISG